MDTILTNKYQLSKEEFDEIVFENARSYFDDFNYKISNLLREIKMLFKENNSLFIQEFEFFLDDKYKDLFPNLTSYDANKCMLSEIDYDCYFENYTFFQNKQSEFPKLSQLKRKTSLLNVCYGSYSYYACICDDKRRDSYYDLLVAYNPNTGDVTVEDREVVIIPVVNLDYSNYSELVVNCLVPHGIVINDLSIGAKACLRDLSTIYNKYPDCLVINNDVIEFNGGELLLEEYADDLDRTWMEQLHWELIDVLNQIYDNKNIQGGAMDKKEDLLNCEKIRADIEPYEERLLTDPNRGHWDLWMSQDDTQYTVEVADEMVARNPLCDVNENGVIAIDFGTKSTIVVYQSDIEHSLPMGIGDGNLSKEPTPKRFENPTVMHFVDLDSFLSDYKSKKGRPKTKWEDLTISHTAMDQFANSKSEEYYEYLHQIKQWAGQREKQFRIQSHDGKTYVLPSFMELSEEEWNPIEFYAYYIGLYINNMRKGHGIFLDYYLSFPVTYEKRIREKIVSSFEKGLKKSLPSPIIENKEVMKRFHVNGDISEPAAYAVCALQEYGFDPEEDEEVFYGIFDFGGGTTDFDFGLWKQSAKKRYDYTIESFGAGGDEFLGGENILEMLAFEIFKDNQDLMREKGYTFTLAPKCTEFLGSDVLLADSQEAEKNMHNLMEKVRPFWEGSIENAGGNKDNISEVDKRIQSIRLIADNYPQNKKEILNKIESIEIKQKECQEIDNIIYELDSLIDEYGLDIEKRDDDDDDKIQFAVTLFDKNGIDNTNEKLYFSKSKLNQLIESRIREGVNNFFSALLLSYQNHKNWKNNKVNILLAGNSCKSPIVKKVFDEVIEEQESNIKEKYNDEDVSGLFEIFPPLGTEEAYEKMESRGLSPSRDDFEKPTGKTGVAFGLIQCRAGGTIERIEKIGAEDEIPFQYYIGWRSKKKFVLFKDEHKITKELGKPDYNVWYRFIEADAKVFDLYYTTLPECVDGELMVEDNAAVKRLRCQIDEVDEDKYVYIRAIDPHTIEYVVAKDDSIDESMSENIVRKEL